MTTMNMSHYVKRSWVKCFIVPTFFFFVLSLPIGAAAATLSLWPDSGVHSAGETISVRVQVNTGGQTINAAEGRIRLSGGGATITSISQAGSIFSLWAEEPRISGNEIIFSGGVPSGYSGNNGTVLTITLRTNSAGTPRLSFQDGSVLAADGQGSNILTNMSGGTYTVRAQESTPEPERVIEYVPSANTPAAPTVTSPTHTDPDGWSRQSRAELRWGVPSGVTAVRTAVTQSPSSVPNQVADELISELQTDTLPDGISYFHIQFRNSDGWGAVGRYRLAVDTQAPQNLEVIRVADIESYWPEQKLSIQASSTAPLREALVKIDDSEPRSYELSGATSTITLPPLEPGYRVLVVEVFDAAGNSSLATLSLTIDSFAAPELRAVPAQFAAGTISVFSGTTTPNATVTGTIRSVSNDTRIEITAQSDAQGYFQLIADRPLQAGIYEISVRVTDELGAQSETAGPFRFVVQEPGYIQVGSWILSILSILVPTVALLVLLVFILWYSIYRWRRLRRSVARESVEAHQILKDEFAALDGELQLQSEQLTSSRSSGQLTKAETQLVKAMQERLQTARKRVEKEVADIEALVPEPDAGSDTSNKDGSPPRE